jgi:hypothetical protein
MEWILVIVIRHNIFFFMKKGKWELLFIIYNVLYVIAMITLNWNVIHSSESEIHTCEPSGGSILLPILKVPFRQLSKSSAREKIKYTIKSRPTFCDQYFWKFPIWNSCADKKRWEIRMVKVNVIFNDIRLLICLTPLQVSWVMVIN